MATLTLEKPLLVASDNRISPAGAAAESRGMRFQQVGLTAPASLSLFWPGTSTNMEVPDLVFKKYNACTLSKRRAKPKLRL